MNLIESSEVTLRSVIKEAKEKYPGLNTVTAMVQFKMLFGKIIKIRPGKKINEMKYSLCDLYLQTIKQLDNVN